MSMHCEPTDLSTRFYERSGVSHGHEVDHLHTPTAPAA